MTTDDMDDRIPIHLNLTKRIIRAVDEWASGRRTLGMTLSRSAAVRRILLERLVLDDLLPKDLL
jgi:hypothetical protein